MQKLLKASLCLLLCIVNLSGAFPAHSRTLLPDPLFVSLTDVPITVNFRNTSLREALEEVRKKSGVGIIYNDNDLSGDHRVNYQADNKPLQEVLQNILKDTNLAFREYKGSIVIHNRQRSLEKARGGVGAILGTLSDGETGELLIGASVLIVGTSQGATTDLNGVFEIRNVAAGIYQVVISYLGYESTVLRDVIVEAGKETPLSHRLSPTSTRLQDIEIIGDKALSGNVVLTNEVSLVNTIKSSPLIITGISAQQIARSVDQDAADVAKRLPGVAVLNSFVNIRGMHERYNLTYLNGMVAPSSETDRRAFSYDLMPSNLIDKMTVYRSPAPELLADWAGGVIKIETKNTAIARQLEVNVSTSFRPGSTNNEYYTYDGGKRDWLGMDDGARSLPDGFPEIGGIPGGGIGPEDFDQGEPVARNTLSAEENAVNAATARSLYNKWNLKKAHHGLDYRAGINYYDSWKLGGMRLTNLTSISTTQAMQVVNQDFTPREDGFDRMGTMVIGRYFHDTISQEQSRWSVFQNFSLHINPQHQVEVKGVFNQLGTDETVVRDGFNGIFSDFAQGPQTRVHYTYRSRAVLSTQISGSHAFDKNLSNLLKWTAGLGYSSDNTPAQRSLLLLPDPSHIGSDWNFSGERYLVSGFADDNGMDNLSASQYHTEAFERNTTFSLDYEKKFLGIYTFKAGLFNERKRREQDARLINFYGLQRRDGDGNLYTATNADEMYSVDQIRDDGSGIYITDNPFLVGQFEAEANLLGAYAAVNIPLFNKKLNIYGGMRYEGQDLLIKAPFNEYVTWVNNTLTDRYLDYWLPSVNVSWSFTEKILMRAAYGKTLNRPNFRELMNYEVNDPKLDRYTAGDSSLVDAQIHNFDLRWEYYPGDGEFISVGGYYKKLHNAIEPYVQTFNTTEKVYFSNTPRAVVYGLEAEIRKSLGFLGWPGANRFSVIGNFALLKSEVEYEDDLFASAQADFRVFKRPLEGTSDFVVNTGLYYEHEAWGLKVSALYNILGQRLIFAPTRHFPAFYERPRHQLDLVVRQRINKYVELKAGVQDLLNQSVTRYADYDRNERYSRHERNKWPYKDWIYQQYKPGSYFTFGLNVTL